MKRVRTTRRTARLGERGGSTFWEEKMERATNAELLRSHGRVVFGRADVAIKVRGDAGPENFSRT